MIETYDYIGLRMEIRTHQKTSDPETWDVEVWISGTRHLLSAFSGYPPKLFPTSEAAIEYGKKAAMDIVDRPTRTKEDLY
jgi:hypothetical protein